MLEKNHAGLIEIESATVELIFIPLKIEIPLELIVSSAENRLRTIHSRTSQNSGPVQILARDTDFWSKIYRAGFLKKEISKKLGIDLTFKNWSDPEPIKNCYFSLFLKYRSKSGLFGQRQIFGRKLGPRSGQSGQNSISYRKSVPKIAPIRTDRPAVYVYGSPLVPCTRLRKRSFQFHN